MGALKLVIFDVDGTLIDSQHAIVDAMGVAAARIGADTPERGAITRVVGRSLAEAVAELFPERSAHEQAEAVEAYKLAYMTERDKSGTPPLYDGAFEVLRDLSAREDVLLGTATGMSRRGMERVIEAHGLKGLFATTQTADDHPSKPNPSMIHGALRETGVEASGAAFIGDTVFDVEAGRTAGVFSVGVTWGYHEADDLQVAGANKVIDKFDDLIPTLEKYWSAT